MPYPLHFRSSQQLLVHIHPKILAHLAHTNANGTGVSYFGDDSADNSILAWFFHHGEEAETSFGLES